MNKTGMIFLLICIIVAALPWFSRADNTSDLPVQKPKYVNPLSPQPKTTIIPTPTPSVIEEIPIELLPPPIFFNEEIPTTESIVYVLDYSQTMGSVAERVNYNTTRSRWDVVLNETTSSISRLSEIFKFNIVVFGTNRGCSLAIWNRQLSKATSTNKTTALSWLSKFKDAMIYGGATPTAPAVLVALEMKPTVIVLLTDGQPSPCGLFDEPIKAHRKRIETANSDDIRIDVFGIGLNPRPRLFCLGIASDSGGMFYEIPNR